MSESTKMNAKLFAKKLRIELARIKKQHTAAVGVYDRELATWRRELQKWIDREAYDRVNAITKTDLKNHYNDGTFDTRRFFNGSPKPPKIPSDKRIQAIQNALRHLGITGQTHVTVSVYDTENLFGVEDAD